MADLLPALANRRARRAFSPEAPPADALVSLYRAVQVAPSHGNTQPTRILVPESDEQRERLRGALSQGNRSWAPAAPVLWALGVLPVHERRTTNFDGSVRELWALHAGIALGNLMTQATALGLLAHPIAGCDEDTARAVFGAPAELRVMALVAIGYPGDPTTLPEDLREREVGEQNRMPLDQMVVRGAWTPAHGEGSRERRRADG